VIVKNFVKENGSALLNLEKIESRLERVSKGASHFEWVDSVLVSAIEHGHWAVFENANLCNASVLDRLNSLLEDGNKQLSMNE
jgi:midasin (ATPase involved in ribosome maturation)